MLLICSQEKLAKSIHYLISKEDRVRTQITELEQLINQTEVRTLTHAGSTQSKYPERFGSLTQMSLRFSLLLYYFRISQHRNFSFSLSHF